MSQERGGQVTSYLLSKKLVSFIFPNLYILQKTKFLPFLLESASGLALHSRRIEEKYKYRLTKAIFNTQDTKFYSKGNFVGS